MTWATLAGVSACVLAAWQCLDAASATTNGGWQRAGAALAVIGWCLNAYWLYQERVR